MTRSLQKFAGSTDASVPHSLRRVAAASSVAEPVWIGPAEAATLSAQEKEAYGLAHKILCHLAIQGPTKHSSGHPGGPLSAFTFAYLLSARRDPAVDQPLRISAGHLSLLSYGLQWLFGRGGKDERLQSPQTIIDTFRIPAGLPGHIEAGIGDIPFGTGPLGKGLSHGVGTAFGLQYQKQPGMVDVLIADGDAQEGQVMEAMRLAAHLKLDNLVAHLDLNDIQLSDMPSRTVACDLAGQAAAAGWQVIEVQDGNDPAQVKAAQERADGFAGKGRPVFIAYYTTMGHGVPHMEEGSNTGKENFHGSPLKKDVAEKLLKDLPALDQLTKDYEPFRAAEEKRYRATKPVQTDILLSFDTAKLKGYARTVTAEKGAARKDFGETHLKALMKVDPRIVVLHADLAASGGFDKVGKEFPDRVVNVGVAEANMYMMAAGMRQTGLLPVTYTFAAFGTNEARANARLIDVNCGHTRVGVLHDCTHAGLSVGEDGETHQERHYLDIPFDHTQVWMPADSNQAAAMAEKALAIIAEGHQSVYVFAGRSGHPQLLNPDGQPIYGADYVFDGAADIVRGRGGQEDEATIIATGEAVHTAVAVADLLAAREDRAVNVRVLNVGCVRPLDASAIAAAALETRHLIVIEDHSSESGLAGQVADVIADLQLPCTLRRLGANRYFPSGPAEDLKFLAGIDQDSLENAVEDEIRGEAWGGEDALVSCLFALPERAKLSRFRMKLESFVERLKHEDGYMDRLRSVWAERTMDAEKLPKTALLQKRLEDIAF
ncbi:MAG: hypothetical protein KBC95_02545 [Candidatus Peribacteraceae bacterium]|nr:hypothetical protein [Candidatus Peribacteraceae bacterium]